MNINKLGVIIPAAGQSNRFSSNQKKVLYSLDRKPVLVHSLSSFFEFSQNIVIAIAIPPGETSIFFEILYAYFPNKPWRLIEGGKFRAVSVNNCFKVIKDEVDVVIIHDGARPLVTKRLLKEVFMATIEKGCAVPVLNMKDNVALSDDEGNLSFIIDRDSLKIIQTPQGFKTNILEQAYAKVKDWELFPDEASIVYSAGFPVKQILGEETNLKLTTTKDVKFLEYYIKEGKL